MLGDWVAVCLALRLRAALLRGVRGRAAGARARSAAASCARAARRAARRFSSAFAVECEAAARALRRAGAFRRGDPQSRREPKTGRCLKLWPDLGEADHRDRVLGGHVAVVELAEEVRHLLRCGGSPGCRARSRAARARRALHLDLVDHRVEDVLARAVAGAARAPATIIPFWYLRGLVAEPDRGRLAVRCGAGRRRSASRSSGRTSRAWRRRRRRIIRARRQRRRAPSRPSRARPCRRAAAAPRRAAASAPRRPRAVLRRQSPSRPPS